MEDNGTIRKFDTGATRDTSANKNDYEGFLTPLVIEAFGDYMNENRVQKDGSLRSSDNWQKGIPKDVYMKSGWRHFMQWWKLHRGHTCKDENGKPVDLKHAICGLLFNVMGYLHEALKEPAIVSVEESQRIVKGCILEKAPTPAYPRYFYLGAEPPCSDVVYVLVNATTGCSFNINAAKRGGDGWGSLNWSLVEMETGSWAPGRRPDEITAEKAVELGLPNCTDDWPTALRAGFPSGRPFHISLEGRPE